MTLFDKLLTYYHISQKEFAILAREPNDGDVPNYRVFPEIENARTRIKQAITNNEKILVYGDYDADGILATAILVRTLKKLNAQVDYYVPSRYLDGYGLSEEKVIKAHAQGYTLIITVDNGVTALAAIKKAHELRLDLIITDHHEYQNRPNALAFLHPKTTSLKTTTSGAMTAFYLSYALLEEIDPYLLIMGATSIISDVMPLREENRFIVKLALKYLNKNKYDQFNLLSGVYTYDETTLSSLVIPKINAVGRIEQGKEVNVLVKYFISDNYRDLLKIRDYVNQVNERRKDLANSALQTSIDITKSSICLKLNCLTGLSGLIANRFLMSHDKPAAIFAGDLVTGLMRGSLRSKNGCNVMDFVNQNQGLFLEFGGHAFAAGVVIKEDDFLTFSERFDAYAKAHPFTLNDDLIIIGENEITFDNYNLLRSFAPFGEDWREPTFLLKNIATSAFTRIGNNAQHLAIPLGKDIKIIGFNYPFDAMANKSEVDLVGKFRLNRFKNHLSLNFVLEN